MLTGELVKPRLRMLGSQLFIDLLDMHDPCWLQTAADLIALLQGHIGQSQTAWEAALEAYEGERVDYIVVRGLAKVLSDAGNDWTPAGLIARYNLELARGVLYWASHMRIEVHGGYKDLWKYLKFFKLMFWIQEQEDGYVIDLDGPISPFVSATTRYGRQFAAFLPALMLCERWKMIATVRSPQTWGMATYRLDASSAL